MAQKHDTLVLVVKAKTTCVFDRDLGEPSFVELGRQDHKTDRVAVVANVSVRVGLPTFKEDGS